MQIFQQIAVDVLKHVQNAGDMQGVTDGTDLRQTIEIETRVLL